MNRLRLVAPLLVLWLTGCATSSTPNVTAPTVPAFDAPAEVLSGDPLPIRLTGLAPGTSVRLTAERSLVRRGAPVLYRATATFEADGEGQVNLDEAAPLEAPWEGVDPRGLFWSMRRVEEESAPEDWDEETVHLSADLDADGKADLQTTMRLREAQGDLVETPLGDEHPGAFLLRPAGDEPLPALITFGGSEGGDRAVRWAAPKLASRGYAVVGLPYYSPYGFNGERQIPELPAAFHNIPIDRLETVRDWLAHRDDILPDRIGLYGISKGAEFVLAGASLIEGFAAVAAIVPSDVIWEGWGPGTTVGESSSFSWRGEPLAFLPYSGMAEEIAKYSTGEEVRLRTPHDAGRAKHGDRIVTARISVEAIDEPVFLVGGDADNIWDSGGMARNLRDARQAAGLEVVAIIDPEAGHGLSNDGYRPAQAPDARVQGQAFPALLKFLAQNLKP